MRDKFQEKTSDQNPRSRTDLLPLISLVLGGGALWFAWWRSDLLISQPDANWYPWIQTASIALCGVLCLVSMVLFFFDKTSAKAMLKTGLSIVPLLLFTNLVIFVVRLIQNIMQGNAMLLVDRLLAPPYKLLIIPAIVIVLLLLGSLSDLDKKNE